jgi:hypothetical protein
MAKSILAITGTLVLGMILSSLPDLDARYRASPPNMIYLTLDSNCPQFWQEVVLPAGTIITSTTSEAGNVGDSDASGFAAAVGTKPLPTKKFILCESTKTK